jgi:signal transduction histidine kinase
MRRYFGNLIGNSIQHGGAKNLELELLCRQQGEELVLEFSDNGVGVREELLQQIFEPLYTTDRGRKVSGLGLSICRSIIRAHGGTVTAENRPGGGLLVRAVLPCAHYR